MTVVSARVAVAVGGVFIDVALELPGELSTCKRSSRPDTLPLHKLQPNICCMTERRSNR
jgi:hypothetical protein